MAINPFILEAPDIGQMYQQGVQLGRSNALQDMQIQDAIAARQANAAMMQDIAAVVNNPASNASDYAKMMIRYPSMSENIQKGFNVLNDAQKQSTASNMLQIAAAAQNGRPDISRALVQNLHDAAVESGDQQNATLYKSMLIGADADPDYLKKTSLMGLAGIYGDKLPDMLPKVREYEESEELQPYKVQEQAGKAQTALAEGALAEEKGRADIDAKREETKSKVLQRDIDKLKLRLDSEKNELERQKLQAEVDEKTAKLGQSSIVAQNSLDTAQDGINAVDRILGDEQFADAVGTGGDLTSYFASSGGKNIRSQLKTLGAQQAMANVNKARENGGLGPLSDSDMKLYASAVANLETDQSAENLKTNLNTIRTILERNRQDILASGKLKTEGGRYVGKSASGKTITEGLINKAMMARPDLPRARIEAILMGK